MNAEPSKVAVMGLDAFGNEVQIGLTKAAGTASPEGNIEETPRGKLQKLTLTPLIWFYILSNGFIDIGIFVFALLERRHPSFGEHIITSWVVGAVITGNTVQIAAMIIAAFKGLFDSSRKEKD